jgi:hypothetical protein
MEGSPVPSTRYGTRAGGIRQSDVSHAADTLLRTGARPTVEKIRAHLGRGSPNTINPMLDAWWKTLAARLDSGPAALHRLPESIAHIAEALWMQAQEEGKRRAALEQRDSARVTELDKQRLELRAHVLTLREGELDSRLRDRDRTIDELNLRLRELSRALRKAQASYESLERRLASAVRAPLVAKKTRVVSQERSRKGKISKSPAKTVRRNARVGGRRHVHRRP